MDIFYTVLLIIFAKACSLIYLHYKLRKYQKIKKEPVARQICARQKQQRCPDGGYYIMQCNLDYDHKGDRHKGIARMFDANGKEFAEVEAFFREETETPRMWLNSEELDLLAKCRLAIKKKNANNVNETKTLDNLKTEVILEKSALGSHVLVAERNMVLFTGNSIKNKINIIEQPEPNSREIKNYLFNHQEMALQVS